MWPPVARASQNESAIPRGGRCGQANLWTRFATLLESAQEHSRRARLRVIRAQQAGPLRQQAPVDENGLIGFVEPLQRARQEFDACSVDGSSGPRVDIRTLTICLRCSHASEKRPISHCVVARCERAFQALLGLPSTEALVAIHHFLEKPQ